MDSAVVTDKKIICPCCLELFYKSKFPFHIICAHPDKLIIHKLLLGDQLLSGYILKDEYTKLYISICFACKYGECDTQLCDLLHHSCESYKTLSISSYCQHYSTKLRYDKNLYITISSSGTIHTPGAPPIYNIYKPEFMVACLKSVSIAPSTAVEPGYVYCFANECMPGICKVGMTVRTPEERLREANTSNTWKPPMPYTIVVAKQVCDAAKTERALHVALSTFGERVNDRREFFRISEDSVKLLFDLLN